MPPGDLPLHIVYLVTADNGLLPDIRSVRSAISMLCKDRLLDVRVDSAGNSHLVRITCFQQKNLTVFCKDLKNLTEALDLVYKRSNVHGRKDNVIPDVYNCVFTVKVECVVLKVSHHIIAKITCNKQWRKRFFDIELCDQCDCAECIFLMSTGEIVVMSTVKSCGWKCGDAIVQKLDALLSPFQALFPTPLPVTDQCPDQSSCRPGLDLSSADSDDCLADARIKGSAYLCANTISNKTFLKKMKTTYPELLVTWDPGQALLQIKGRYGAVMRAAVNGLKELKSQYERCNQLANAREMIIEETGAQSCSQQSLGRKAPESDLGLQKQETTVSITEVQPWQVDFLTLAQGKGQLPEDLQQTLTVNSDTRTVHVRAPQRAVNKTVAAVWKYVASLSHQEIPLTAACSQMLQTSDSKQRVQRVLDAEGVVCDWHVQQGHLVISANYSCFQKAKGILMAELESEAIQHGNQPPTAHDKNQLQTISPSPSPALEEDREESSPHTALQTDNAASPSLAVHHRVGHSAAMSPHRRRPSNKRCASALPSQKIKRFCSRMQPQTQHPAAAVEAQEGELIDFNNADTEHRRQHNSSQPHDIPLNVIPAIASSKSNSSSSNNNNNSLGIISNNCNLNNRINNNSSLNDNSLNNSSNDDISTSPQLQKSSDVGVRLNQLENRLLQMEILTRVTSLEHRMSQMERERVQVPVVHTETRIAAVQQQLGEITQLLNDIRRQQNSTDSVITGICNPSDTDSLASASFSSVAE